MKNTCPFDHNKGSLWMCIQAPINHATPKAWNSALVVLSPFPLFHYSIFIDNGYFAIFLMNIQTDEYTYAIVWWTNILAVHIRLGTTMHVT